MFAEYGIGAEYRHVAPVRNVAHLRNAHRVGEIVLATG